MGRDVLQYHYGIVHDHTYRYGKCRHRYNVQGIARSEQIYQGSEKRYRNGQNDDERRPPPSEEEEDDETYHYEGDDDCLKKRLERIDDVSGAVDYDADLHIGRQFLLKDRQLGLDVLDNLDSVGSSLLGDGDKGGTVSVGIGLLLMLGVAVHYPGDIAQVDRDSVILADNDIQHLVRAAVLALDSEGIVVGAHIDIS